MSHSLLRAALIAALLLAAASTAHAARILIIKNSDHEQYEDPARVLRVRLGDGHELRTLDLTGLDLAQARQRGEAMMQGKPDVLVALGDKALYLANNYLKPTPVVFAMVSQTEGLALDRARVAGISTQLEPETMASQIKMFLPKHRRIGVVYTKAAQPYVEKAMLDVARLQLTLIPVFIEDPGAFATALRSVAPALDLFWLVEDANITTADNIKVLMETAADEKLVTLCHSPGLVRAGLTVSISPDREEVGRQLAEMIERIIAGASPATLGVTPPAKARVTLNREQVEAYGIEIDPMLIGFTHQVSTTQGSGRR